MFSAAPQGSTYTKLCLETRQGTRIEAILMNKQVVVKRLFMGEEQGSPDRATSAMALSTHLHSG